MTYSFRRLVAAVLICAWLPFWVGLATAAPTSTKFPPTLQVQGSPLVLSGSGTRYRAVFKVYDLALYAVRKVDTVEDALGLPGPKRLNFAALRELDTTDIGLAFVKAMRANATKEQVTRHTPAIARLIEVFSARAKLANGDTFAMEYMPGKGTTFYILGESQGAAVGDAEFFQMVLNIWLGQSPADPLLKDALLNR